MLFDLDLLLNVQTLCRFVQLKPLQVKCFDLLKGKDIVAFYRLALQISAVSASTGFLACQGGQ